MTLPPNEGGKTKIPGVHPQRREALAKLHDEGNWNVLLNSVETVFPESLFWLDLQRYADAALGGLGQGYAEARRAVREETRNLLRRLPGLASFSFQDGSRFCDGQTNLWIESDVLVPEEAEGGAGGSTKAETDGKIEAALKEAKSLATGGEFPRAIETLRDAMAGVAGRRERFLWELELAKLCLASGYPQLAGPILEQLDDGVIRYNLEEWEPALSLEVVRLRYQIARRPTGAAKQPTPESIKRVEELFSRLCRLDVAAALAMEGGEKK
jgi:type VI secretion system protein VasJ